MLIEKDFVTESLELHMFFARIMKEHAIFLMAGFTPANPDYANTADFYKQQFEQVLQNAVSLGGFGIVSPASIASHEFVTDFTYGSEQKTINFTGININTDITRQESGLWGSVTPQITQALVQNVNQLNAQVMPLLDGLISFKKQVINSVSSCYIFTTNYPEEGKHILEEANHYKEHLTALMNGKKPDSMKEEQEFWDDKMEEHSEFIRGKLNPTEKELFKKADNFDKIFESLLHKIKNSQTATPALTQETINETAQLSSFKQHLTDGINRCKIKSVMLPLFTDHILREANHFLRVLKRK